jgi:hypothetical protein
MISLINILYELLLEPSDNEQKMGWAFSLYEIRYEYILVMKPNDITPVGKFRCGGRMVEKKDINPLKPAYSFMYSQS